MSSSGTSTTGDSEPETLPGLKLDPDDDELVEYYLKKKIEGKDSHFSHMIPVIDVNKSDPHDLAAFFRARKFPYNKGSFFFSQRNYMSVNRSRISRLTDKGFYKPTGKVVEIKSSLRPNAVIGKRRILTFYEGRVPKHKKTDWILHEFGLTETATDQKRDFVLYRLKKSDNCKKHEDDFICDELAELDTTTGGYIASNSEDDQAAAAAPAASGMILDPEEHQRQNDALLSSGSVNHDEWIDDWWSSFDFGKQAVDDKFQQVEDNQGSPRLWDYRLPPMSTEPIMGLQTAVTNEYRTRRFLHANIDDSFPILACNEL